MKAPLRYLSLILLLLVATTQGHAKQRFAQVGARSEFNYTYISSIMLRAMAGTSIDSNGYVVDVDDLDSMETISTTDYGTDKEFWETIRALIKEEKLETLSTNKSFDTRFDMLGAVNSENEITHLLLIQQNTGLWVTVTYLTGKIPASQFKFGF